MSPTSRCAARNVISPYRPRILTYTPPKSPTDYTTRLAVLPTLTLGEDFDAAFHALFADSDHAQRLDLCQKLREGRLFKVQRYRDPESLPTSQVQTLDQLRHKTIFAVQRSDSPDIRDDLCNLAWHFRTAALLGVDPREYLRSSEPYASPYMTTVIQNLVNRKDNRPEHWALHVVQGPVGPYLDVHLRPLVAKHPTTNSTPQYAKPWWQREILPFLFGRRR